MQSCTARHTRATLHKNLGKDPFFAVESSAAPFGVDMPGDKNAVALLERQLILRIGIKVMLSQCPLYRGLRGQHNKVYLLLLTTSVHFFSENIISACFMPGSQYGVIRASQRTNYCICCLHQPFS